MKSKNSPIILLLILAACLWAAAPALWDLWGPDECRYVQVSKELLQHGNPFRLTVNGEFYEDKPPLPFILMAIPLALNGGAVNSLFCRYPSIIISILILIFTYYIGRRLFSERAGLWAALCLMTAPLFWQEAPSARLDMQFSFWVLFPIWIYAMHPKMKLGQAALFWLGVSCGALTKGPVILIFILAFLLGMQKNSPEERPFKKVYFLWGIILTLLICLGWMWAESRASSMEAIQNQAKTQIIKRIFSPSLHKNPFWYYIFNLPVSFAPWIIPVAAGAFSLFRYQQFRKEHLKKLYPLVMWICLPLIFFSILGGKREQYLLPIYPALALFAGWYISEVIWDKIVRLPFFHPMSAGILSKKVFVIAYTAALIALWIVFPLLNQRKSPRPLCLRLDTLAQEYGSNVGVLKYGLRQTFQVYGNYKIMKVFEEELNIGKETPSIILVKDKGGAESKHKWQEWGYAPDSKFKLSGDTFEIWVKRKL